jgi:catechol-2,3-dioxygenase
VDLKGGSINAIIGHIGINLSNSERLFEFWQDLLRYFGFSITDEGDHFDASDGRSYPSITTTQGEYREAGFHRRRTGLTHVAFNVPSREQVDEFVAEFLAARGIEPLYGGAKPHPDYFKDYYAAYFEEPDRIKIEVAYDPWSAEAGRPNASR